MIRKIISRIKCEFTTHKYTMDLFRHGELECIQCFNCGKKEYPTPFPYHKPEQCQEPNLWDYM